MMNLRLEEKNNVESENNIINSGQIKTEENLVLSLFY